MKSAFISYSQVDSTFTDRLEAILEGNRVPVFRFDRSIAVGDSIPREIENAIAGAELFFLIISQASLASGWVRLEYETAIDRVARGEMRLIPILIGNVEPPPFVRHIRWFRVGVPADLDRLPALMFKSVAIQDVPPGHLDGFRRLVTHGKQWRGIDLNTYRVLISRTSEQELGGIITVTRDTAPFEIIYEREVSFVPGTWDSLRLTDVDEDGHPELSYIENSYGTGGGCSEALLVRCKDGHLASAKQYYQSNKPFDHETWLEFSGSLGETTPYRNYLRERHQEHNSERVSGHELLMQLKTDWKYANSPFRSGPLRVVSRRGRVFVDQSRPDMGDSALAGIDFETASGTLRCPIASRIFDLTVEGSRLIGFYKDGVYQHDGGEVFPIFVPDDKYDWCDGVSKGSRGEVSLKFRDGGEIIYEPVDRRVVAVKGSRALAGGSGSSEA